jgi:hypothetical protein
MRKFASIALLLAIGAITTASLSVANAEPTKDAPCVEYWAESRYVIGYDHLVHIKNDCLRDANCAVSSDVNPTPQVVEVKAGQELQVATWRGSPSYRFVPYVTCSLAPS